ncbi:MAG: 50S ribosomal protein L3 [Deltaproteobacteria bacterium]|nr:MAG: 50S ribosomal protein L3 [Deltaproteobacteria bacterium]
MAERMGLLGKKLGMTQVYAQDGECIPVTVILTRPNVVVGKRTIERDGYSALQLGFEEKPERLVTRPERGAFVKAKVKPMRVVRELRLPPDKVAQYEVGQIVSAKDVFVAGRPIDVTGTTKGRGTQGVIKRHGMAGTKASHGVHEYFRHGGSIGCRLTPGHVKRGKRMAGRMGVDRKTVQNLELVDVDDERGLVLVRGAVPGPRNGYVLVRVATKKDVYHKRGRSAEQERSKNPLKASKKAAAGR